MSSAEIGMDSNTCCNGGSSLDQRLFTQAAYHSEKSVPVHLTPIDNAVASGSGLLSFTSIFKKVGCLASSSVSG